MVTDRSNRAIHDRSNIAIHDRTNSTDRSNRGIHEQGDLRTCVEPQLVKAEVQTDGRGSRLGHRNCQIRHAVGHGNEIRGFDCSGFFAVQSKATGQSKSGNKCLNVWN